MDEEYTAKPLGLSGLWWNFKCNLLSKINEWTCSHGEFYTVTQGVVKVDGTKKSKDVTVCGRCRTVVE